MNTTRSIFLASLFGFFISWAIFLPSAASAQAETRYCTMQYDPVCGAKPVQCIKAPCYPQYQTYGNACTMANDKATLIHKGECTPTESGPVKEPPKATSTLTFVPPPSCRTWFDGCNVCARMSEGAAACTKRFCSEPKQGYCTSYESEKSGSTSPELHASSTLSSTTPIEEQKYYRPFSFLMRAWVHFLSWLRI